ncbi:urease accessory protein UreD [Gracilibacillus kekensis]|uniref:Urease accessory protein UreH n=1 Tax=Gracilibacillus kekensis TaxID=1027249 RepID=A0A1M7JDT9_9BACI|nr:urease accessory protein UreD [Gracilibacillus kekensis]SHM51154.1 Urease accessory protein UreH [Gracilibacillus kekensis]
MLKKQLKARFQKVNLLDYQSEPPLHIEKSDEKHRIFTSYLLDGWNESEAPMDIHFTVKKASNIKLTSPIKPAVTLAEQAIDVQCDIEEEALLFFDKREVIPSNNSTINEHIKINVRDDAEFIWAEIIHLNQSVNYRYQSLMEIWDGAHCISYDPIQFSSQQGIALTHHGLTEDFPYMASIWYISPNPPFDEWDIQQRLSQAKYHRAGMTDIDGKGILIRWLSTDISLLKQEVDDVLSFFDEKITELRKWRV